MQLLLYASLTNQSTLASKVAIFQPITELSPSDDQSEGSRHVDVIVSVFPWFFQNGHFKKNQNKKLAQQNRNPLIALPFSSNSEVSSVIARKFYIQNNVHMNYPGKNIYELQPLMYLSYACVF